MKIEVNASHAIKGLENLSKKASDLSPLMMEIAGFLADVTEDAFDKESDPTTGDPWQGLLSDTIATRKKRNKWPGKILQVTGDLATKIITDHGSDYAQIGSNLVYATAHQFGFDQNNLPARPFIGLSDRHITKIEQMIGGFLSE